MSTFMCRSPYRLHAGFFSLVYCVAVGPSCHRAVCEVDGSRDRVSVDQAAAACTMAQNRFYELFGAQPPPGRILLNDTIYVSSADLDGGTWIFDWPTAAQLEAIGIALGMDSAEVREFNRLTLTHELGHRMAIAYLYPNGFDRQDDQYATPMADWLDEAIAIWMEPASSRRERLSGASEIVSRLASLDELLASEYSWGTDTVREDHGTFEISRTVTQTSVCNWGEGAEYDSLHVTHRQIRYSIDSTGRVTADTALVTLSGAEAQTFLHADFLPKSGDWYSLVYSLLECLYQAVARHSWTPSGVMCASTVSATFHRSGCRGCKPTCA